MRRQNRPAESSLVLISPPVEEEGDDKSKKVWLRRHGFGNSFTATLARDRLIRWIAVLVAVLLIFFFFKYVVFPRVYESLIRRHPLWVFRRGSEKASSASSAIFYHVYIPPNKGKKGIQLALDVVREQLGQVGSLHESHTVVSIYYTTTGVEHAAQDAAERVCYDLKLQCHWMGHWTQGQEDLTLSRLYDFCQYSPSSIVSYLHTKGSYHGNQGRNHAWRWHLTKAALTCASELRLSSCNVCGLQFYPVWTTFFPGNMWTASCSYVNKLLAPSDFGPRLEDAVKSARDSNKFIWSLYNASNPGNMGLDRYAMEHWVASHPLVRPCEILTDSPRLEVWYEKNATQSSALVTAPQHVWTQNGWFRWNVSSVQSLLRSAQARKEYFLLPGFLYKWQHLYGQVPPPESWVWRWYPQGQERIEVSYPIG